MFSKCVDDEKSIDHEEKKLVEDRERKEGGACALYIPVGHEPQILS
jgi:hypothetical protein